MGSSPGFWTKISHALWPKHHDVEEKQHCNNFNKKFKIALIRKNKNFKNSECTCRILIPTTNQRHCSKHIFIYILKSYCTLLTDSHLTQSSNYSETITQNLFHGIVPLSKIVPIHTLMLLLLSHFSRVRLCVTHRRQPTRLPHPWDSPGKNTGVGCHFLLQCVKVKVQLLSCVWLFSDPIDCSLLGSSVHEIF